MSLGKVEKINDLELIMFDRILLPLKYSIKSIFWGLTYYKYPDVQYIGIASL